MFDVSTWGTIILGSGGLITGILALFSARANKNKTNSEVGINLVHVEQSREQLHQSRELFWRTEVENVRDGFSQEVVALRNEMAWLRVLIENHVPWDWEVVRQLKLAGIDFRDPPTLNYIKSKHDESEES